MLPCKISSVSMVTQPESSSCSTESTHLLSNSNLSSQSKTFGNIFIAIVGAGVLGLPYAFKKTGWLCGIIILFLVALLTYYCMMLLVRTRRKLHSVGVTKITSFGDLGQAVCGRVGRFSVDLMIVLSQASFCASYLIFIGDTLANLINGSSHILGIAPKIVYISACFPFQLGLNAIPTLTHLAPLSIFADVVDLGAMGIVMVEDALIFIQQRPSLQLFGGFSYIFYGIGVSVYSFEGIGMILPLESEAAEKEKFGRTLGLSVGFIAALFGLFGLLGYFAFGEETKGIITTNLGKGILSSLVQIGLCINLFFTFPLMMNPVHEVVERMLSGERYCVWLRWGMVLLVSLVAALVPDFADFVSLVGSSVCMVLGFVFPALFHLIVYKEESSSWTELVPDVAIIALGVCLAVSGTLSSLIDMFSASAKE